MDQGYLSIKDPNSTKKINYCERGRESERCIDREIERERERERYKERNYMKTLYWTEGIRV